VRLVYVFFGGDEVIKLSVFSQSSHNSVISNIEDIQNMGFRKFLYMSIFVENDDN
jgi:hypothetical protein